MHGWRFGTLRYMDECIRNIRHCSTAFPVLLQVTDVSIAHQSAPARGEITLDVFQSWPVENTPRDVVRMYKASITSILSQFAIF